MQSFTTKPVEDVIEKLIDYRGKTPPKTEAGIKLITAKVVKGGIIKSGNHEYISKETYDSWMSRGFPRCGDVLITTEAPLGEVAQLTTSERVALAQRIILLRANSEIALPKYLYYALQSDFFQAGLQARATGTTVLGIKQSELRKVDVPLFPLEVQQQISIILSAYDNLLENNTRRIRVLENLAQLIYREWFVDFRFPGHEDVAMVDSALGLVPEGWRVVALQDVCEQLVDGDWIETKHQSGDDYRLLQVSNVGTGEFVETGKYRYVTEKTFRNLNCTEVKEGHILISRMPKPIGRAWLVRKMPWRMITAVDVAIAVPDLSMVSRHYLMQVLNSPENLGRAEKLATGTTRLRISRKVLSNLKVLLPPMELQRLADESLQPLDGLIWKLRKRNNNLRQTRDMLLPKLISGELNVSQLQVVKEEV